MVLRKGHTDKQWEPWKDMFSHCCSVRVQRMDPHSGKAPSSTCDVRSVATAYSRDNSEVARSWRYFESFLVSRASLVQIAQTKPLENALN